MTDKVLPDVFEMRGKMFPLSLYIHVPFCAAKCGYCSFYSLPDISMIGAYVDALRKEANVWRKRLGRIPVRTIYVGGGTPSILPISMWRELIRIIESLCSFDSLEEATSEANPSSLSEELLLLLRDSFFTRISLGVQSLDDGELRRIGRIHDRAAALSAMEAAASSGLRLSADLIFGLPGQTLRSWRTSLKGVVNAGAQHISAYQLTLEPDTPMGREMPILPDGYPFYRYAQWLLPKLGFEQYEISSFAPTGMECRHNMAYWRQENVLALGPAAWGYLDGVRYANPSDLSGYLDAAGSGFSEPFARSETLNERERAVELAVLMLRTRDGIVRADFSAHFGSAVMCEIDTILNSLPAHLFYRDAERVSLTQAGMRVGNAIWSEIYAGMERYFE